VEDVYEQAAGLDIDLDAIVDAIHESNMSKLGEDGKPIYREGDGKVLKGPGYKTPTDDIRKLVFGDNYAPASE
jgi:predicted HAD superfamily Cof-like phosphohydrolase